MITCAWKYSTSSPSFERAGAVAGCTSTVERKGMRVRIDDAAHTSCMRRSCIDKRESSLLVLSCPLFAAPIPPGAVKGSPLLSLGQPSTRQQSGGQCLHIARNDT